MSNMSYCRFQNTLTDLQDCWEAINNEGSESLKESSEELEAAKEMMNLMMQFISDHGRKISDL